MLSIHNPPNPWHATDVEWEGEPEPAKLEVYEETARSILSENSSPDLPFRYSVNPYRGCFHGCAYCYARPSHQYWDFGAGTDFERKIVVKTNAVRLFEEALSKKSWRGEPIVFSGNTDCYQPLEASYRLTRGMLELCVEHRNSVSIITKSGVIMRDLELLGELARTADVVVTLSIAFDDESHRKAIEPWTTTIDKRFHVLHALRDAGVRTGISLSPIIIGLNEDAIPRLLARAKDAGVSYAMMGLLRLPAQVQDVFLSRVREALPMRAQRIEHAIMLERGGKLYNPQFGARFRGESPRWKLIDALFKKTCDKLGIAYGPQAEQRLPRAIEPSPRVRNKRQLTLF